MSEGPARELAQLPPSEPCGQYLMSQLHRQGPLGHAVHPGSCVSSHDSIPEGKNRCERTTLRLKHTSCLQIKTVEMPSLLEVHSRLVVRWGKATS